MTSHNQCLSISKVNFYATRTTYGHCIPLCAKANLHGFQEILSALRETNSSKKNNPGEDETVRI